jgi:hypothetical protein
MPKVWHTHGNTPHAAWRLYTGEILALASWLLWARGECHHT